MEFPFARQSPVVFPKPLLFFPFVFHLLWVWNWNWTSGWYLTFLEGMPQSPAGYLQIFTNSFGKILRKWGGVAWKEPNELTRSALLQGFRWSATVIGFFFLQFSLSLNREYFKIILVRCIFDTNINWHHTDIRPRKKHVAVKSTQRPTYCCQLPMSIFFGSLPQTIPLCLKAK